METSNNRTAATITHLSIFSQYFIPFGNFIFPLAIWSTTKESSLFCDRHGRQAINFQLSLFMYTLILMLIAVPILLYTVFKNVPFNAIINDDDVMMHLSAGNVTGVVAVALISIFLFGALKIAEFFLVIYASVKAANGEEVTYPLTIRFLKDPKSTDTESPAFRETSEAV